MARARNVLAALIWVSGGIALGQETLPPRTPSELPAIVPDAAVVQPAPVAPAAPVPPATDAAKPAPTLEELGKTVETLGKTVETLGKNLTVVTGDEQIKLVLGGVISADFYYNHARPVAPGIPFFLTPRSPFGFNTSTFDANARGTTLFGLISGPRFFGFESGGLVALCLFNDALVVDRYGILPLQAYAQLKNDDWRFAAGLQFDIFNPLNPQMLAFSQLSGSGNAGFGFPGQARVERYFRPDCDTQITLTAGISEPLSTTVNNQLRVSEDNGWPNLEARAAVAFGPLEGEGLAAKRPFEWGVSGLAGEIRTTDPATARRVVPGVWGLGTDLRWAVTPTFGFMTEVFTGETLGNYTAGVLQNVNLLTFKGIHSTGGWVEMYYYICPEKLHTHLGYGIDDPWNGDLAPTQTVRNETYYLNLVWDPSKYLRFGWELTYRRTEYLLVRNNDGFGFQTQMQFRF